MPDEDPMSAALNQAAPPYQVIIDCIIEEPQWQTLELEFSQLLAPAIALTLAELAMPRDKCYECALILTSDAHIAELNAEHRGKNQPTNILSFPYYDFRPGAEPWQQLPHIHLGDMFLAYTTIMDEIAQLQNGLGAAYYLTHLIVHGTLHLFAHDHEEEKQAEAMEDLETKILQQLNYPSPYTQHNN